MRNVCIPRVVIKFISIDHNSWLLKPVSGRWGATFAWLHRITFKQAKWMLTLNGLVSFLFLYAYDLKQPGVEKNFLDGCWYRLSRSTAPQRPSLFASGVMDSTIVTESLDCSVNVTTVTPTQRGSLRRPVPCPETAHLLVRVRRAKIRRRYRHILRFLRNWHNKDSTWIGTK